MLSAQGVKSKRLNLQYAFHSSQVDVILNDFEKVADAANFHKSEIPVLSPLLSDVISGNINASYVSHHARGTVKFSSCIEAAREKGLINNQSVWVEIGPHPIIGSSLAGLHLAGVDVQWGEYHRDFLDCVRMLGLLAYAFDNSKYWLQYTGDWNLTKGQTPGVVPGAEAPKPSLSTTSIHRVLSEVVVEGERATTATPSWTDSPDQLL
ncbi:MAG: hypothetical protein LQ349_006468 [Xanthoria aureola]|nr:MAG: hypothetical protein LQ349_006468 [Xanthoria aureola]